MGSNLKSVGANTASGRGELEGVNSIGGERGAILPFYTCRNKNGCYFTQVIYTWLWRDHYKKIKSVWNKHPSKGELWCKEIWLTYSAKLEATIYKSVIEKSFSEQSCNN